MASWLQLARSFAMVIGGNLDRVVRPGALRSTLSLDHLTPLQEVGIDFDAKSGAAGHLDHAIVVAAQGWTWRSGREVHY